MYVCDDGCNPAVQLIVEIALTTATGPAGIWDVALWDTDVWGLDAIFVDVSEWVRSVKTERKFDTRMRTWQASSATVVLGNLDGRFSPGNLDPAAPYVVAGTSGVRPGCPIRIRTRYNGITYAVFYGYAEVWSEGWELHEPRAGDAIMTVECIDVWGRLGRAKGWAVPPVGTGESFGSRISRLLDVAGFTGTMHIATGVTTMQATDLSDDRITEINKTAQSEGGTVHAEADGSIVAKDRYGLVNDTRSINVQATFGDGPGEIAWSSIAIAPYSASEIINNAVYARVGGTDQHYNDPVSITLYGQRDDPDNCDDLLCENDAQVAALAEWAVITNKYPEAKIEKLSFNTSCDLSVLAPLLFGLHVRDLTTITIRPPSATSHIMQRYCFVSGIAHEFAGNAWTPTLYFTSATAFHTYADSRWDTGLWGSSSVDLDAALWFV